MLKWDCAVSTFMYAEKHAVSEAVVIWLLYLLWPSAIFTSQKFGHLFNGALLISSIDFDRLHGCYEAEGILH